MRPVPFVVAVAFLLLGSLGGVQAEQTPDEAACVEVAVDGPPCGYINPFLYLDFDDNIPCGSNQELGVSVDYSGCMAPPEAGTPITMDGTFTLTWEISEEGFYLNDPNDPIEVSFHATGNNPSFINFQLEPSSFTLDSATLLNPTHYVTKERASGQAVWYEYTAPISVTFTRTGEPSESDIERIQNKDGEATLLIRIHSDESGTTYRDSYGLESFDFHIRAADDDPVFDAIELPSDSASSGGGGFSRSGNGGQEAPLPSVVFAAGAVFAAMILVRRR